MAKKVFISYAWEDESFSQAISERESLSIWNHPLIHISSIGEIRCFFRKYKPPLQKERGLVFLLLFISFSILRRSHSGTLSK